MTVPHPLLADQRNALRVAESQVTARITGSYARDVRSALAPAIRAFADRYARELARVRAADPDPDNPRATVSATWLHDARGGNLAALQAQVRTAITHFARDASAAVTSGIHVGAELGQSHAQEQVTTAIAPLADAMGCSPEHLLTRLTHAKKTHAQQARARHRATPSSRRQRRTSHRRATTTS